MCNLELLWSIKANKCFNTLNVNCLFRFPNPLIVLGNEDGCVECVPVPNSNQSYQTKRAQNEVILTLESKGGPIQSLMIHDVTRLYKQDLIVADSKGAVTFFCNEQILSRRALSDTCITCMKAHTDPLGNVSVIVGDKGGNVIAFNPYQDQWRVRAADSKHSKPSSIRCLLPLELTGARGQVSSYVLAADDSRQLHFIQGGVIVKSIITPSLINTMASGHFVLLDALETDDTGGDALAHRSQVALGSETGAIYILSDFQVYSDEYVNIQVPIKQLETLKAADSQKTDTLLCVGNFDGLSVIRNAKEVTRHRAGDWVRCLVLAHVLTDSTHDITCPPVILGTRDNNIQALSITNS